MSREIRKAQLRIKEIKKELVAIDSMRPGKVTQQQRKDKNGNMYGSYWQLGYTYKMRSRNHYIPEEFVKMIKTQNDTFKKFKSLTEEWVGLALMIAQHEFEKLKKSG